MPQRLPAGFAAKSADEKLSLLWASVTAQPYRDDALPAKPPGHLSRMRLFTTRYLRRSFEHESDEVPEGRAKLLHAYGTCARVTLERTAEAPYTGLFATGAQALLRFSDGAGGGRFAPAIAIKFPIDGASSLNFFAFTCEPPRSLDPLDGVYSNATFEPRTLDAKLLAKAFQRTASTLHAPRVYPTYLPLDHLAGKTTDGQPVAAAHVPDRLELHPTEAARAAAAESPDFRRRLASIPDGIVLFDVAVSPDIKAPAVPFGIVRLDTRFVASRWGDERLFFQHDVGRR